MKNSINVMKNAILFLAVVLSQGAWAIPLDVIPSNPNENRFIKVTLTKDRVRNELLVGFMVCFRNEPISHCQQIGGKKYYTMESLEDERGNQKWKLAGTIGLDALLIACAGTGGAGLGLVLSIDVPAASTALTVTGAVAAGSVGAGALYLVDVVNPIERYKKIESLSDEVITGQTVMTDEDMTVYINRLEQVLENID